jgi:hypothetical protein
MQNLEKFAIRLALITIPLLGLLGSGCTSTYKIKCDAVTSYPTGTHLDSSVVLVLENDFAGGVVWTRKSITLSPPMSYTAPGSLEKSAEALTRALFRQVQLCKGSAPNAPPECDALVKPHVVSVEEAWDVKGGLTIFLEWTVTRPNGQLVWKKTIKGEGIGAVSVNPLFQRAITQAFQESYAQMSTSPEIRALARPSSITPNQLETDK